MIGPGAYSHGFCTQSTQRTSTCTVQLSRARETKQIPGEEKRREERKRETHVAHGVEAVQPEHYVDAELPEALVEFAQSAGAQLRAPPPKPPLDLSRRLLRLLT